MYRYFSKAYSQWVNHGTYFPMIFRWKFILCQVYPVPGGPCSRRCRKGVPFCCAFSKALVDHWRRSAKFSSWALHRDFLWDLPVISGLWKWACCPDLLWKMGFLGWFTQQQSWFHGIFMGFSWRWFIRLPENWISWVIFMEESMGWWSNMINGCSSGLKHGWLGNLAQMGISFPLTGGYLAKTEHSVDCCGEKSSLEIMISTPKSRGLKSYSGNGRIHLDSL